MRSHSKHIAKLLTMFYKVYCNLLREMEIHCLIICTFKFKVNIRDSLLKRQCCVGHLISFITLWLGTNKNFNLFSHWVRVSHQPKITFGMVWDILQHDKRNKQTNKQNVQNKQLANGDFIRIVCMCVMICVCCCVYLCK